MCGGSAPGFLLGSLGSSSGPQQARLGTGGGEEHSGQTLLTLCLEPGVSWAQANSEPQSPSLKWGCGVCHLVLQRSQ